MAVATGFVDDIIENLCRRILRKLLDKHADVIYDAIDKNKSHVEIDGKKYKLTIKR